MEYPCYAEIKSVEELIGVANKILENWNIPSDHKYESRVWFRGQVDDLEMRPKVFRSKNLNGNNLYYNEFKIVNGFKALYKNYTERRFDTNIVELFSYMQHYGVPTRLLDWSENLLTSLFFAIENVDNYSCSPVLWVLNTGLLNSLTFNTVQGPLLGDNDIVIARMEMVGYLNDSNQLIPQFFENFPEYSKYQDPFAGMLEKPLAFYPISSGNNRIITQKGMFTIHGIDRRSVQKILIEENKTDIMRKIIINSDSKYEMRNQLIKLGINYSTVYPDLQGFAMELSDFGYMSEKT